MKTKICSILLFIAVAINAQQKIIDKRIAIPVSFFKTTNDFIEKKKDPTTFLAILRDKELNTEKFDSISKTLTFLDIKKIVDINTHEKIKDINGSWALEYNGKYFYNMDYSTARYNNVWWVEINKVIGKYFLIYAEKNNFSLNPVTALIENSHRNAFGLDVGLKGGMMNIPIPLTQWQNNFKDKHGKKFKILLIDTSEQKNKNSYGRMLTRKMLKKLAKQHNIEFDAKKATFEEVIEFIEKLNH